MVRRWDNDQIVSEIEKLHKKGVALNSANISMNYGYLYGAACSYFGSWKNALEVAGFDYSKIKKVKNWSKKVIIEEIRRLHLANEDLSPVNIKRKYPKLFESAGRYLGSWREAVLSAGINYEFYLKVKKRDKDEIIRIYKSLIKKYGYPPLPKDLHSANYGWLVKQVASKFGGFESFFSEIGVEYKGRIYWDEKRVIKEFKEFIRELDHVPSINEVRELYRGGDLVKQIYKRFGNYYTFLKEIDVEPKKKHKGFWTKDKIKKEYFKLSRELGYFPSYSDLRKLGHNDITVAIQRVFNGATNFYKYINIRPRKRVTIKWDANRVLEEFRRLSADYGRAPTEKELRELDRADLAMAIRRYFGSYKTVQEITGIEQKSLVRKWTIVNIKEEYKELIDELGFQPTSSQLWGMHRSGLAAAISQKIGFGKLLTELGYEPRRKDNFWSKEKVKEEYIKEREKMGRKPTMNKLKKMRSDLFSQISRRYEGINRLDEELGFVASKGYYNLLWKSWENFVIKICEKIYGEHHIKRLPNGGIPDYVSDDGIIIDAKLSYYEGIEDDIIKYAEYCKRLEFWICENYVSVESTTKVKYLGISELEELLKKHNLRDELKELSLFEKGIDPLKQAVLI